MGARTAFRVFLGLFGVTAILIAALHVALGPRAIPGSVPVNATMDSVPEAPNGMKFAIDLTDKTVKVVKK